jgi:predicted lactoylglutathione lyase
LKIKLEIQTIRKSSRFFSSTGYNSSSKGLSKEKLQTMGVEENKGYY